MFKTPYKSIYRIQTIEEALEFELKTDETDMYLYLIDMYDVLLNNAIGKYDIPKHKLIKQRQKMHNYLMKHFHRLYTPIPGRLHGWAHNMLVYVVLLTIIELQYDSEYPVIPDTVHEYCVKHRIRMYKDRNTKSWKMSTWLDMLDVVSLRWRKLLPCDTLKELLEILWRVSAKMLLFMYSQEIMDMYYEPVTEDYLKASPVGVVAGLSRYYWFHQTIYQYEKWPLEEGNAPPLSSTNWDTWITIEKKHIFSRRFRDGVTDFLWNHIINYGDHAIGSHDQLGDEVSNYAVLYMRFPANVPTSLSKICTYKEYEDMLASDSIRDILYLKMIHAHFRSHYDIDFTKIFTVWEPTIHKHIKGIERSPVPLIISRYWRYHVYYKGKTYKHPEGESFPHAFVLWLKMLREHLDGVCFQAMDFNLTIQSILDEKKVVDNTREMGTFFDLEDD